MQSDIDNINMKKVLKIIGIVILSLFAIIILATLLISPIATSYVNKKGQNLIGRDLHVDKLKVNIYNGHVAIHNLKVYEEDGKDEFAGFDTLDVQARLLKLIGHKVYLSHITLAGLNVNVLQNGDKFNFTSLLDHFASEEEAPEETPDTTQSDWKLYFYNIRLSHGHVYYADQQRGCDWTLKDLNLKVPGFCIGGDDPTDAGLSIELAEGGVITTDAHYDVATNDFNATVSLDRLALENARAYATEFMKIGDIEGYLDAHIHAQGNLSHIMDMDIDGDVELSQIDIKSDTYQPVLALNNLAVEVSEINLENQLYHIKSVRIDGLKGRFDRYEDGNNFSRLFTVEKKAESPDTLQQEAKTDTAKTEERPMDLKVESFSFTHGQFAYNDHTLPDPFEFPVTNIDIQAENLTLSGRNSARIKALLPHGGNALIKWEGNIDDIKEYQSLTLNIRNLQLADLSPYTVAYLGSPFEEGVFSFVSSNNIRDSKLEGQNHLDIYKPTVGAKRKDVDAQINIPLKAALYVLKNKDDQVQIDLPISGNLDNPEFKYMKAVWKTLGNLLVKVATEPFRMAGDLMGINKEDESFIAFDPMQQDITSEQYYNLERYANAVLQTPSLILNLEQQIAAGSDSTLLSLAEQRNQLVMEHLVGEMGVNPSQLTITTTPIENLKKSGYRITGRLIDTENQE